MYLTVTGYWILFLCRSSEWSHVINHIEIVKYSLFILWHVMGMNMISSHFLQSVLFDFEYRTRYKFRCVGIHHNSAVQVWGGWIGQTPGKFSSSLCWAASPCQLSVAIMSRPGTFVLCLLGGATVAKLEFDVKTHYRRKYKQISLLYHQTIFGDIFIK